MTGRLTAGWIAILLLAAGQAVGGELTPGVTARVAEIIDGDTLVLESGDSVRLVGIQAPKLPLGRAGFKTWPLADAAKRALSDLALGRMVTLGYGGARMDRHGRRLAHLHRGDGLWLQGELLDRGWARVYSFRDNRALIAEMLVHERAARAAGRGIWGHPFYRVRSVAETASHIDSFQLIEGRVLSAARVRGRAYLNFGDDWRRDFTVTVAPRDRRAFERQGIDLRARAGRRLRVRGWLKLFNGPMVEVTHPEQIEWLD